MNIDLKYSIDEIVYDRLSDKYVKLVGIFYSIGKIYHDSRLSFMGELTYCVDDALKDGKRDIWEIEKADPGKSFLEDEEDHKITVEKC